MKLGPRPRIIPVLLVRRSGLVKTVKFRDEKYVGDPLNAVKIFNEKSVDELVIIDIDATAEDRAPDLTLLSRLAGEARMPICYGGGVRSAETAESIIKLGIEKVAFGAGLFEVENLVEDVSNAIGSQSIVAVLDVKKRLMGDYVPMIRNGRKRVGTSLIDAIENLQKRGTGEFFINNIDRDGQMQGYDLKLAKMVKEVAKTPVTFVGGAGGLDDIKELINCYGLVGCAAGSMFVFKGKYKAVLISYPDWETKKQLLSSSVY